MELCVSPRRRAAARAAVTMRRAVSTLLIDNYDSYTYNLYQQLCDVNEVAPLVYHNDQITVEAIRCLITEGRVHNIVISPGPGTPNNPDDMGVCLDVLREFPKVPILGVCLGHQALAVVHGGAVGIAPEPVHGRVSELAHSGHPLFDGIPSGAGAGWEVVRYHSLLVDAASLPSCLEAISWTCGRDHAVGLAQADSSQAGSDTSVGAHPSAAAAAVREASADGAAVRHDGLIMALAHRSQPHYGVQFHPESVATKFGRELLTNFRDLTCSALDQTASGGSAKSAATDRVSPARPAVFSCCGRQLQPSSVVPPVCPATSCSGEPLQPSPVPPTGSPAASCCGQQLLSSSVPPAVCPAASCSGLQLQLRWTKLPGLLTRLEGGTEQLFHELIGWQDNSFWLDSATAPERGQFSFMGGPGGPLWRRFIFRLATPATSAAVPLGDTPPARDAMRAAVGDASAAVDDTAAAPAAAAAACAEGGCRRHGGGTRERQPPGYLTIQGPGENEVQTLRTHLFDYLEEFLAAHRVAPDAEAARQLPFNFWGGLVGYLGYELKAECGGACVHSSPHPDAALLFADRLLVADHRNKDLYLIAVHNSTDDGSTSSSSGGSNSSSSAALQAQWMADTEAHIRRMAGLTAATAAAAPAAPTAPLSPTPAAPLSTESPLSESPLSESPLSPPPPAQAQPPRTPHDASAEAQEAAPRPSSVSPSLQTTTSSTSAAPITASSSAAATTASRTPTTIPSSTNAAARSDGPLPERCDGNGSCHHAECGGQPTTTNGDAPPLHQHMNGVSKEVGAAAMAAAAAVHQRRHAQDGEANGCAADAVATNGEAHGDGLHSGAADSHCTHGADTSGDDVAANVIATNGGERDGGCNGAAVQDGAVVGGVVVNGGASGEGPQAPLSSSSLREDRRNGRSQPVACRNGNGFHHPAMRSGGGRVPQLVKPPRRLDKDDDPACVAAASDAPHQQQQPATVARERQAGVLPVAANGAEEVQKGRASVREPADGTAAVATATASAGAAAAAAAVATTATATGVRRNECAASALTNAVPPVAPKYGAKVVAHGTALESLASPAAAEASRSTFRLRHPRQQYLANVAACRRALYAGESYEICLTTALVRPAVPDPQTFYRHLRSLNPAPYGAWLHFGGAAPVLCCSSPERFLRGDRGGVLEARPIKGTAPRHRHDPVADARAATTLAASEKDRAENLMIVDLLRNDLGKVCEAGSIHVPGLMEIESFATVHQMVSTVVGRRRGGVSSIACLRAAFPGGSMTGAPKVRSMHIIDELEGHARGVYSGCIGFLSLNDTFDLNIVIRTAVIDEPSSTAAIRTAVTDEPGCSGAAQPPTSSSEPDPHDSGCSGGFGDGDHRPAGAGCSTGCSNRTGGTSSGTLGRTGGISIGAGGAIVVQSEPEGEYEEMRLKARALLHAVGLCDGRGSKPAVVDDGE